MQSQDIPTPSVAMQHQFQSTQSSLLTLPRELRDQIIDYILHGINLLEVTCIDPDDATRIGNPPLLTCQQLRSESLQRIETLASSSVQSWKFFKRLTQPITPHGSYLQSILHDSKRQSAPTSISATPSSAHTTPSLSTSRGTKKPIV